MTGVFLSVPNTTDVLRCHIHLPVCLWIMDPHSRAVKKNASHGNEVLPQDTTHLIQRSYVTNEEVCAKIQQAIGPQEDPLTIIKRCKLKWYGHLSRSSGLAKTIFQGIHRSVKGGRRLVSWGNWLWGHLWCPNDPLCWGISEGDIDVILNLGTGFHGWWWVGLDNKTISSVPARLSHTAASFILCTKSACSRCSRRNVRSQCLTSCGPLVCFTHWTMLSLQS